MFTLRVDMPYLQPKDTVFPRNSSVKVSLYLVYQERSRSVRLTTAQYSYLPDSNLSLHLKCYLRIYIQEKHQDKYVLTAVSDQETSQDHDSPES